jgi:hypothetical protein
MNAVNGCRAGIWGVERSFYKRLRMYAWVVSVINASTQKEKDDRKTYGPEQKLAKHPTSLRDFLTLAMRRGGGQGLNLIRHAVESLAKSNSNVPKAVDAVKTRVQQNVQEAGPTWSAEGEEVV